MKPRDIKTQEVFNRSMITIKIKHTNITRLRIWIGTKLIKYGINLIGCEDNIIMEKKESEETNL